MTADKPTDDAITDPHLADLDAMLRAHAVALRHADTVACQDDPAFVSRVMGQLPVSRFAWRHAVVMGAALAAGVSLAFIGTTPAWWQLLFRGLASNAFDARALAHGIGPLATLGAAYWALASIAWRG